MSHLKVEMSQLKAEEKTIDVLQKTLKNLRQAVSYGESVINGLLPSKTTHTWVVASTDKEGVYTISIRDGEPEIKVYGFAPQAFDFNRAQEIANNTVASNPKGPIQFRAIREKEYYSTKIPIWKSIIQTIEAELNPPKNT